MPEKEKKIKNPGAKGGKFYINGKGHVVYGEKPKSDDRVKYDPSKEFKDQFPSLAEFVKRATENGLQTPTATEYKQVYQREHKAFMKAVDEAKSKGGQIKGLGDKKDFLNEHVKFNPENGAFKTAKWEEVQVQAKLKGIELTKEEFMKHYKQEKYAETKWKNAKKPEPEKKVEKEPSVFGEGGIYDYSKFPKLEGSWKASKWAFSIRGQFMKKVTSEIQDRAEDEQEIIRNLASRLFIKETGSSFWIENKDNSLKDLLSGHTKNEKEKSILESFKEAKPDIKPEKKVEPEVKPKKKPEPEVKPEKTELNLKYVTENNWYNFHDSYGGSEDIKKKFPELKGGSKQIQEGENARNSMILGWTMKTFNKEYVQNIEGGYNKDEIKLFADAVNNMIEENSAKKWISMDDDYKTPFHDKLLEYSSDKENFGKLVERWKQGKKKAEEEYKKQQEEEKKKKEEEEKKKQEEKEKHNKDLESKQNDESYQKEQVKKLQSYLDGDLSLYDDVKVHWNSNSPNSRIDALEKNVLGYRLTDWEKLNLRENMYDLNGAVNGLEVMIKSKINPQTGMFNKNVYDNYIRDSKIEIENFMNTQMKSNLIHEGLDSIVNRIDSGDMIKLSSVNGKSKNREAFNDNNIQIAKEIISEIKSNSKTNSEAINYLHEMRKNLYSEIDMFNSHTNSIGTGYGNVSNFHKFTPEEKENLLQKQSKLYAIDKVKEALSEVLKDSKENINKGIILTENNNEPLIQDMKERAKKTKSKGLKEGMNESSDFYSKAMKSGVVKLGVNFEKISGDRAYATGNTVFASPSKTSPGTYIHEIAHVISNQNSESIGLASNMFISGRTNGVREYQLHYTEHSGYGKSETARIDSFMDAYTGRNYYNGTDTRKLTNLKKATSNEVISMGVQRMYNNPVEFLIKDPEHFALIHSVLKGKI